MWSAAVSHSGRWAAKRIAECVAIKAAEVDIVNLSSALNTFEVDRGHIQALKTDYRVCWLHLCWLHRGAVRMVGEDLTYAHCCLIPGGSPTITYSRVCTIRVRSTFGLAPRMARAAQILAIGSRSNSCRLGFRRSA